MCRRDRRDRSHHRRLAPLTFEHRTSALRLPLMALPGDLFGGAPILPRRGARSIEARLIPIGIGRVDHVDAEVHRPADEPVAVAFERRHAKGGRTERYRGNLYAGPTKLLVPHRRSSVAPLPAWHAGRCRASVPEHRNDEPVPAHGRVRTMPDHVQLNPAAEGAAGFQIPDLSGGLIDRSIYTDRSCTAWSSRGFSRAPGTSCAMKRRSRMRATISSLLSARIRSLSCAERMAGSMPC